MNEASNNPVDDRSGLGETIATALRQPSFLRIMLFLATTVVVFVGMRLSAPILNPILSAVILALLFSPIYSWLTRHRIPTPLALIIMLVGLTILFLGLFLILGVSIARFSVHIASYAGKLTVFGRNVVRQLGLRAIVNLVTGAGVTVLLLVLRVDFPLMWGILAFFLSFIPWIGLPLAVAPAVVLALAEHGIDRALLVIVGVILINILAENALSPMLMGRGLSLSPTILFIGFIF